ncbi:MAG TPA: hypothetical protein VEG44_06395 [Candidatus Acidoferrales bacterium]|nr:hypothetical protein [Candidatus Acidoferrales bacterium]
MISLIPIIGPIIASPLLFLVDTLTVTIPVIGSILSAPLYVIAF